MVGDRVLDLRDHSNVVVFRFDGITQRASWSLEASLSDARSSLHFSVYCGEFHTVWSDLLE